MPLSDEDAAALIAELEREKNVDSRPYYINEEITRGMNDMQHHIR